MKQGKGTMKQGTRVFVEYSKRKCFYGTVTATVSLGKNTLIPVMFDGCKGNPVFLLGQHQVFVSNL